MKMTNTHHIYKKKSTCFGTEYEEITKKKKLQLT
jgi:hypothetical protein